MPCVFLSRIDERSQGTTLDLPPEASSNCPTAHHFTTTRRRLAVDDHGHAPRTLCSAIQRYTLQVLPLGPTTDASPQSGPATRITSLTFNSPRALRVCHPCTAHMLRCTSPPLKQRPVPWQPRTRVTTGSHPMLCRTSESCNCLPLHVNSSSCSRQGGGTPAGHAPPSEARLCLLVRSNEYPSHRLYKQPKLSPSGPSQNGSYPQQSNGPIFAERTT
jgi:hypothetical protein